MPVLSSLEAAVEKRFGRPLDPEVLEALREFLHRTAAVGDVRVPEPILAQSVIRALAEAHPERWASTVGDLRAADLALACALADGDPKALARFERDYVGGLDAAIATIIVDPQARAEVLQALRVRLFVPSSKKPPRIGEYAGRSSLARWLRSVAIRAALHAKRSQGRRREVLDPQADDAQVPRTEPDGIRAQRLALGRKIVRSAFVELSRRDQELLKLRYLQGVTAASLAVRLGVHESTVSRRLEQARKRLRRGVKGRAWTALGAGVTVDALVQEALSDVGASLTGLFSTPNADSDT